MKKIIRIVLSFGFTVSTTLLADNSVGRREQGMLVLEGIPELASSLKERWLPYENIRSASFQSWLPKDQGLLISTRFGESSQIHALAAALSYRQQLTFFDEPVGRALAHPEHEEILLTKDQGGNEDSQIYLFDRKTAETRLMTDGRSRNDGALWTHKGDAFVYASTSRNGRDVDLYWQDRRGGPAAVRILEAEGSWSPLAFRHDDQKLLVLRSISAVDNRLYVLDLASRSLQEMPRGKEAYFGGAVWAKDGGRIFVSLNQDEEFKRLYEIDLKTLKTRLLSGSIPWDIESLELTADGKALIFSANEAGTSRLYKLDTKSSQITAIPLLGIKMPLISRLDAHPRKAELLALTLGNYRSPGDVFTLNLKSGKLTAWTQSEMGGLNPESFIAPELMEYPSFDQVGGKPRQIPAYIYRAPGQKSKAPVVISIHGGPEAQYRPGFSASFQYYLRQLGITVIAPNVRGSSGYGKSYLNLDNGFLREDSVKDIGALLDWIAQQPDLDAQRVVVMGGSYGGYMTLASLVHFGDRLAGGINSVGISHFLSFLANTRSYRQDLRRVEYGDERDPAMKAFLDKISPLTQVDKIRRPLFVIQGLNDPRVPASEAEQIVKAVRQKGVPVWYLLARDEGHGFRKKSNQSVSLQATSLFLQETLLSSKVKE